MNAYIKYIKEQELKIDKEIAKKRHLMYFSIPTKETLINAYLFTAYKIGYAFWKRLGRGDKWKSMGTGDFWDFIQQANLGLLLSVKKFQGVSVDFERYTYAVIKYGILEYVRKRPIVSVHPDTYERLKGFLDDGKGKIENGDKRLLLNLTIPVFSLDAPRKGKEGKEGESWEASIEDKKAISPNTQLVHKVVREWIEKSIESLPDSEREVLTHYFGFAAKRENISSISKKLNIPVSEVNKKIVSAITKLRHPSRCAKVKKRLEQIKEIEEMMEV